MRRNKKYLRIHKRKKRGGKDKTVSSEELLIIVKELFDFINTQKFTRDLAKGFDDISCRVDLVGCPQTSFVIGVAKRELYFSTAKQYTDMAIGVHKDFFLELIENPPRLGNIKFIYNNIIFRKGVAKLFKYSRPILSATLLAGNCKNNKSSAQEDFFSNLQSNLQKNKRVKRPKAIRKVRCLKR